MKNQKIIIPYSQPSALSPQPFEKGFTLVEMAIILVVIGILVGLGSGIVGMLSRNIKYTESREIVDADVESVISYAAGNDYLPTDLTTSVVRNPNDAFLQPLIYVWDTNLAGPGKTICGKKTTAITLTPAAGGTVSNVAFMVISKGDDYTTDTTLSGTLNGTNVTGAITGSGYVTSTCTGTCSVGTCSGGTGTCSIVAESNKDIVKYVTLFELKAKIKCD